MKHLYQFLAAIILSFTIFTSTSATTGGPTFVYELSYNPLDESVYYVQSDHGGRGCPPELFKLSLNSKTSTVVYSCDEAEKNPEPVSPKIASITAGFKYLIPVSLAKNNIEIDVAYASSSETFPGDSGPWRRTFTATVYQDGKKGDTFSLTGCSLEQPFLFEGYALPSFNKKLIILSSTKGDCMEGGYVREALHVSSVENVSDKNYSAAYYKQNSALVPNEATLVVYENQKVEVKADTQKVRQALIVHDADGFGKPSFLGRFIRTLINFFYSSF